MYFAQPSFCIFVCCVVHTIQKCVQPNFALKPRKFLIAPSKLKVVKTVGNELLKCPMCGSYFNKKCYLDNHILRYHNNPTEMTNVNRNLKPILNMMPTKNQVVITKVQGQNKEIQLQLPPNFLLCPICGSYFTQKFRLDKHMAEVHEPKTQQKLIQTVYQCYGNTVCQIFKRGVRNFEF